MRNRITIFALICFTNALLGCGEDKYKGIKVERNLGYVRPGGPSVSQQMVYGANAVPNNAYEAMDLSTDLMTEDQKRLRLLKGNIWIKFDLGKKALASGSVPSDLGTLLSETGPMVRELGFDKTSMLLKDIQALYTKGYEAHLADESARKSDGYKPSGKVLADLSATPHLKNGQMDVTPDPLEVGMRQMAAPITNATDYERYVKSNHVLPSEAKWIAFNAAGKKIDEVADLLGVSANSAFRSDKNVPDFSTMPTGPVIPSADPFGGQ